MSELYFYNTVCFLFQLITNSLQRYERRNKMNFNNGNNHSPKNSTYHLMEQRYFLVCDSCYWTASTYHPKLENFLYHGENCPV